MKLSVSEKIRLIAKRKKIGVGGLADRLGYSRQNLNQRLIRNAWTEEDLHQVAEKLGCALEITFIDNETGERY